MAQKIDRGVPESPSTRAEKSPTAQEMQEWYQKNKKVIENYAAAEEAVKRLRDITKSSSKMISAFSKDQLRTYFQNIGSNEQNLRSLSRYLYYRSQIYYRLVMYYASLFCLDARAVIPAYDLVKGVDSNKMLKSYYETLKILDKMNLPYEITKGAVTCWREDVFYGVTYYDDSGFFILPLDPDYCKISGVYSTGDFAFAFNCSYFRSRQDILESWGEPFTSMHKEYESSRQQWQDVPPEYGICLKVRAEDWETIVPPLSGIFNSLISLLDLEDIQAISDEQQIYKMIWMKLDTISGSDQMNDWRVDPQIMMDYFNRMVDDAISDYSTAVLSPGDLNVINFNEDQATDTNKIGKATEAVLNTSGGAQILNSATISGAEAFRAAMKSDGKFATGMLLPQIQAWLNRFLSYQLSNPSKVKFFDVSIYTKDEFKANMLKDSQYGLPGKLAIKSMDGFTELDTLALNYLEEEVLNLSEKLKPLNSSYVQSGSPEASDEKTGGRPKDEQQTTSGEESEEKRDKAKG